MRSRNLIIDFHRLLFFIVCFDLVQIGLNLLLTQKVIRFLSTNNSNRAILLRQLLPNDLVLNPIPHHSVRSPSSSPARA